MYHQTLVFIACFIGTIAFTRIVLAITRAAGPTVLGLRIHHYVIGVLLWIIGILWYDSLSMLAYIGYALFIDELPCLIFYGNTFGTKEYTSTKVGVLLFVLCIISIPLAPAIFNYIGYTKPL